MGKRCGHMLLPASLDNGRGRVAGNASRGYAPTTGAATLKSGGGRAIEEPAVAGERNATGATRVDTREHGSCQWGFIHLAPPMMA